MNAGMTKNLVDWATRQSPETMVVYISTDQVYDGSFPSKENAAAARNVYSKSKLEGEALVLELPRGLVLRTNFFGFSPYRKSGLVEWSIKTSINGNSATLFTDVHFNPIHASHLASIIVDAIEKNASGVYNAGASGGGCTKADFCRTVLRKLELSDESFSDGTLESSNLEAYRPRDMRMDCTALEAIIQRPMPSLEDGIALLPGEYYNAGQTDKMSSLDE